VSRKALNSISYARNAFDIESVKEYNVIGAERKTNIVALILMLKAYFERLVAESQRGSRKTSIFSAISDSLYNFLGVISSETDIASWMKKRSSDKDIRIINWDAILDGHLQFYAEHRGAIDAVTDQYLEEVENHLISKKKKKEK
jgi:hypothetical protein